MSTAHVDLDDMMMLTVVLEDDRKALDGCPGYRKRPFRSQTLAPPPHLTAKNGAISVSTVLVRCIVTEPTISSNPLILPRAIRSPKPDCAPRTGIRAVTS